MTEKLYYEDAFCARFSARVTACREAGDTWLIALDKTAFFPEGGGQASDTGSIGPARITDVQEKDGEIWHRSDRPLPVGEVQDCQLDWEQRFRRMQNHTGEHIVSGLVHSLYGYENVGFHMGAEYMTMDYSGELSREELDRVETLANIAVREDLALHIWFPAEEALSSLVYRSKLELTENVRIVEIPGIDRCACCAPHVARTGQVGVVKILTAERHRGGTRITALCGMDALEDYRRRQDAAAAVSQLLSVPRDKIAPAVERLLQEEARYKERVAALSMETVRLRAAAIPFTKGNLCVFDDLLDEIALRELVNLLTTRCTGLAAAFSGSDAEGWRYIIGSRSLDLRANARAINAAIGGKGGGSREMIQGRATAGAAQIRAYIESASF